MKKIFSILALLFFNTAMWAQTCGPGTGASICSYGPISLTTGQAGQLPSNGGLVPGFDYECSSGSCTVALQACIGSKCVTLDSYSGGSTVRTPDEFSVKVPSAAFQYFIVTPTFASGTFTVLEVNNNTASAGKSSNGSTLVNSVTGEGTVSCSPTTGNVVCTGSGGSIADTANLLKGDGAGNAVASQTTDNGIDPVLSALGFDTGTTGGLDQGMPNQSTIGTVLNTMTCQDPSVYAAVVCPHTSAATNIAIGVAVPGIGTAPGKTGNVSLCYGARCQVLFDNQTTAGHYAIDSSTTDGYLHDTGLTTQTAGTSDNFLIDSNNSGSGTLATIRLLTPDQISANVVSKFTCTIPLECPATGATVSFTQQHNIQTVFANLNAATPLYGPTTYSGTLPANFASTPSEYVRCAVAPSGTITFTLADCGAGPVCSGSPTTLGTIAVSSSCVGTFATSGGTSKTLTAGHQLIMTPSGTDGNALGVTIVLYTN